MRTYLLFVLFLIPAFAAADGNGWVPYTDGRVGGCAVSNNGALYGCTPQPTPPPAPAAPLYPPEVVYAPVPAPPVNRRPVAVHYATPPPPPVLVPYVPPVPAMTPGVAAAVNAQIERDLADPDAALQRELDRAKR